MKKLVDILQSLHPNFDFEQSRDFFMDGYLDSFDLTKLIVQLEDSYDIELDGEDVRADNFKNVEVLQQLLERYGVKDF